jgi:hypothetical protein
LDPTDGGVRFRLFFWLVITEVPFSRESSIPMVLISCVCNILFLAKRLKSNPQAGNPLGGLVFSDSLPSTNGTITQGENWSNFVGGNTFCIKVCDNSITSPDYCQNIYDLIGCTYNMPSNAYTSTDFTSCEGDLQMQPGLYVENGQTLTWSQPASLSPNTVLPWTPSIPASSSCTTYTSAQIYAQESGGISASTTASGSAATGTGKSGGAASGSSPTGSGAAATGTSNAAAPAYGTGAGTVIVAVAFAGVGALLV